MEVIVSDCEKNPSCPHGPCLIFERYSANGSKTGKQFYACSACRDRSECSFFQWVGQEMTEESKEIWERIKTEKNTPFSAKNCAKRLEQFKSLPADEQVYCRTCSLLLLRKMEKHSNHDLIKNVTSHDILHPSSLFETRENKKVEAQYFFNEATVTFIVSLLKDMGFSKIVSIGTPGIHECIKEYDGMKSFLMDIDHRYMQFFNPTEFCRYNMFNNHFFDGKSGKKNLKAFLKEAGGEKVAIVLDPPFGGLIDAVSHTIQQINKWWKKENDTNANVAVLWVFPYFHEGRIIKNLPDMKMMDYKVEYVNHKKFRKNTQKMSPVRIFTNVSAASFVLPTSQGYRFCKKCQRYVSEENKHCSKCNACTTKHGKTYHHCDDCQQCVKSSYIHCEKCNKCGLSSEVSSICKNCKSSDTTENGQNRLEKCFKCKGVGHRKRNCPEGFKRQTKKRKVQ